MIPAFNLSGVLPPFDPAVGPASSASMSPYVTSMTEFVKVFSTSPERIQLIRGFLAYRDALRAAGIADGFQWVDGSFTEEIERIHGRAPADIDLVTFASRPVDSTDNAAWSDLVNRSRHLFSPAETRARYYCDAYFVDLTVLPPDKLVDRSRYWFGLFSHQRDTSLWKGMLQVQLVSDDAAALKLLP
jgi:hypothetical protein